MGSTGGTIQGSFGWDNNPLLQGMNEAQGIVARGASQMEQKLAVAEKRFTGLFKRSPHMRAERALSGFFERAASGDIVGAISQISGRMTGLGIVAGVAIGAGVAIFTKFKEQIDETKAAHEALRLEMVKRPLSTITSLSSEGMEQALGTREKLTEDLSKKSEHTFGAELFAGLQTSANDFLDRGAPASEKERIQVQKDINKSIAEGKAIMEAQVALSATMFGIRRQELEGDERQAAIAKVVLQAEQQRAALKAKGLTAKAFNRADEIISQDAELSITQINKKAHLKESELKMEERIADLQHKGLAGDDLKRVRAGLEIKSLDDQIANEASPSAKRALQLQRSQKVTEAHGLLAPAGPSNPFPFGTTASRGFDSQFGFGGFAKRGIEDSLGFGGLARRSIESGDSLTPEEALLKTGTSAGDIAGFRKNVGGLPGEKQENPELVGIMTDIRNIIDEAWRK